MSEDTSPPISATEPEPVAPEPVSEQTVPEVSAETPPIDSAQGGTAQITLNEPLTPEPITLPAEERGASAPSAPTTNSQAIRGSRELMAQARAEVQNRKQKKLEKIMTALNSKKQITNDEVEKLLHVSDATATRYLSALVKQGKIKQTGKTGHYVAYTKI